MGSLNWNRRWSVSASSSRPSNLYWHGMLSHIGGEGSIWDPQGSSPGDNEWCFFFCVPYRFSSGQTDRQLRVPNNCLKGAETHAGGKRPSRDQQRRVVRSFASPTNESPVLRGLDGVAKSRPSRRPATSGHNNNATLTKPAPRPAVPGLAWQPGSCPSATTGFMSLGPRAQVTIEQTHEGPASTSSRQLGGCLLEVA